MNFKEIKDIHLFKDLTVDELEAVGNVAKIRKYPKNSVIVIEEEFGDVVYMIKSGTVKISRVNDSGKEVILALLGSGEFFGEMAILDGHSRSANAMAQEQCEIFAINRADFSYLLTKYHKISMALLQELALRIRKSDKQIEVLSLSDAEHRIGVSILSLAESKGIMRLGQVTINHLPLQQDIANIAGTSRETVSRVFKLLEDKSLIIKEGHSLNIPDFVYFKKVFGKLV
jgi:CRP/FNR family transcriptional regulator, cyclic AMP receptor protein